LVSTVFAVLVITAFCLHPRRVFLAGASLVMCVITCLWNLSRATNEQDWEPEFERLPRFCWENGDPDRDDKFTLSNIRDFTFRTEEKFDKNYLSGDYKMSDLSELDYIMVYWSNFWGKRIAHSMLCFRFKDGRSLVISCEARQREKQEKCADNIIGGLFHQYSLIYIVGTECDLLALRTNVREPREDAYCFPVKTTQEQREKIFRDLAKRADALNHQPEFYNTVTANCITALLPSITQGIDLPLLRWEYLSNGYFAEWACKCGLLQTSRPDETYEELLKRCHVNPKVKDWDGNRASYTDMYRTQEANK